MTASAPYQAIEGILDTARWAPSGDNAQPWSFRIVDERAVEVLIRRTDPNIYEYRNGEPTLISAGGLLENIEIAAPSFGLKATWRYLGSEDRVDRISVDFLDVGTVSTSELLSEIPRRSVDRRPFKTRSLTNAQKVALADTISPDMEIQWFESLSDRRRMAALSGLATRIRLSIPETFSVHRSIVDWKNKQSPYAIPSGALGLDPVTLMLTRWSMVNWGRTRVMNALGAPGFASLQMDFVPGLLSGAYFAIRLKKRSTATDKWVTQTLEAGQAIQRLWLRATQLGLVMQPCVAILAFWSYAAAGHMFTSDTNARRLADVLARKAGSQCGALDNLVFMARIGIPRGAATSRSVRRPLAELLVPPKGIG